MNEQRSGLGQRIPARSSRVVTNEYDLEEDEAYYVTRPHTSARRYDLIQDQVIQQGNKRYHIRHGSPPAQSRQQYQQQPRQRQEYVEEEEERRRSRRVHFHPLVFIGFFLFAMIGGYIALSAIGQGWQKQQDDWTYGQMRTYQTDAVVGHSDSSTNPSHFIALNLRGQIIIIELPGGNAAKARSYTVTTIQGNEGNPPVKVSFQDINADGKLDMIITIGDPGSSFTIMLFNDGTQFVSKLK
jgi:hypothetical protein